MAKQANKGSFLPGGRKGGRKKGVPNKATIQIRELATSLTTGNPDYIASLKRRILKDKLAPAIENTLLWYAHGKPKETVEVQGENGGPLRSILRVIVDPKDDSAECAED